MLGNQMLNGVHQLDVIDYAEEEFVNLYFAIVKYSLPDLEWFGGRNFVGFIWSSLWFHVSWGIEGYPEK